VVFIVEFSLCFISYFATWVFLKTLENLKTLYWKQQHLWRAYELNYEQIFQELKEQPRTGKQMEMIELYCDTVSVNLMWTFFYILFFLAWSVEFATEGYWEFAQWTWEEKEGNADNRAEFPRNDQLLGKPGMINLINKTAYGELSDIVHWLWQHLLYFHRSCISTVDASI
jgi:hypothetical protein